MHNREEESLKRIIGCELSSVVFVKDYVQLRFDGPNLNTVPYLNALNNPYVVTQGQLYRWDDSHYRDRLCMQIGHTVASVAIWYHEAIDITFENEVSIRVSLKPEEYEIDEAAIFHYDPDWWVITKDQ